MTDTWPPPPPDKPLSREMLFHFQRESDGMPMSCEVRYNGESAGWEIIFYQRGELLTSRGAFVERRLAVQWAAGKAIEKGGDHGR